MPIPKVKKSESKNKFISRCISRLSKVDSNRPHKQIVAICHTQWRAKKRIKRTKVVVK